MSSSGVAESDDVVPEMPNRGGSRLRLGQLALAIALIAVVGATDGDRSPRSTPGPAAASGIPRGTIPAVVPPVAAPIGPSEPAAVPPARTATMPPAVPVRVEIPSIGVDSGLMGLGLLADGSLEVPPGAFPAGWFTGAPTPGELGPAIIVGHVDWAGEQGVFFRLRDLAPGDPVVITRRDGSTARFRVTRVERFAKDRFPTREVYGDLDHAGLRLITCGGAFDREAHSYEENLVVFAELLGPDAP